MKLRALVNYRKGNKTLFLAIITAIMNGIFVNTSTYATPPVTKANYTIAFDNYIKANRDFVIGGNGFKSAYTTARAALVSILDSLNEYVNAMPSLSLVMIGQSGFMSNNPSVSSTIPLQAVGLTFKRLGGNALETDCTVVVGTEDYGAILVEGGLLPIGFTLESNILDLPSGTSLRIRHHLSIQRTKQWHNLTVGLDYNLYYYSKNSAGVSVLSAPLPIHFTNS